MELRSHRTPPLRPSLLMLLLVFALPAVRLTYLIRHRQLHQYIYFPTSTSKALSFSTTTSEITKMTNSTTTTTDTISTTTSNEITKTKHYIFGYGSLMCPHSRSITVPTLPANAAHPVIIEHLQRTWSARCMRFVEQEGIMLGWTAMGIQFQENAKCTGVLIEVDDHELAKFDIREGGYDRKKISIEHVHPIPDLPSHYLQNEENHTVFQYKKQKEELKQQEEDDDVEVVNIWVYVQKNPEPANSMYPIPQSYVDIIVRGCLSISPTFAKRFLETTHGWYNHDNTTENSDGETKTFNEDEKSDDHHTWVNDRHVPMYVRADPSYSQKMGKEIDEMIQEYHGDAFEKRKNIESVLDYKVEDW